MDHADGGDGLYVGISTANSYSAAKAAGVSLHATSGTIDGFQAVVVPKGAFDDYYTVQVALGGPERPGRRVPRADGRCRGHPGQDGDASADGDQLIVQPTGDAGWDTVVGAP